jgi:hypothetical protein
MRRIVFLFVLMVVISASFAQTSTIIDKRADKKTRYVFEEGDTIKFYPTNPDYSDYKLNGYTCFYNTKALKSGIKPKYRFAANNMNITPCSEIEGSYFYVKAICDEQFDNKNKLTFSAVLERLSDHTELCFAFPKFIDNEFSESVINSWIVKEEKGYSYFNKKVVKSLVIPFLTKDFIDGINSYYGKAFLFSKYYNNNEEDYNMLKFANGESNATKLAKSYSSGIELGTEFVFDKLEFISWNNKLAYKQPYVSISNKKGNTFRIPVAHYAGNSNPLYIIRGNIENLIERHFIEKDALLNRLGVKKTTMDHLIGNTYYFNNNSVYFSNERTDVQKEVTFVDNTNLYIPRDGYYKIVDCDLFPNPKNKTDFYDLYLIFEDSIGRRFKFPPTFEYNYYGKKEIVSFTKVFDTKEAREEKLRKDAKDEAEKKRLMAKYGDDVGFAIWVGKCTEERYANLCRKYGKKKAGWMARRIYEVGWTYDEFCEAKNPIVKFECVHTYENRHAYYEVYDYGGTYITFKNSVIVSISDYPSSNF